MQLYYPNLIEKSAFCPFPFTRIILQATGDVAHCCYQKDGLGNILNFKTSSAMDLWNGDDSQNVRKVTEEGNLHNKCKSGNCPFIHKSILSPLKFKYNIKYPIELEIDLPETHCNIGGENPGLEHPACITCTRNFQINKINLTDLLCSQAKPLMPHLKILTVLGTAEPFWKNELFRVLKILDFEKHKYSIKLNLNTNAICVTDFITQRYFKEVHTSSIAFSVDSSNPQTYEKIRRLDAFDKVVSQITEFTKYRNKIDPEKKRHSICIYNNINLINVNEMPEMVKIAKDCGVDWMVMVPTRDQNGTAPLGEILINKKNEQLFKKYSIQAKMVSEELKILLHYPVPFAAT